MILEQSPAKLLFLGKILEENIYPFPALKAEEAETLAMVLSSIDKFMQDKAEALREHDEAGEQPEDYIEELRKLGLFGLIIPEEFEGLGFSNSAYSRVLQQTTRYDGSTSLTVGAHSSIGMKGLLLFGTDAQKQKYLPSLASGEQIAAFCLTESGAGSDAASIKTVAVKGEDGVWTLNGEKIWITNGGTADFFTVFARTDSEAGKITAFIVERSFPGVSSGPKEDKLGIRASCTTTVHFDNVKVPAEQVIGEEGHGFKVAMAILNNGRTGLGGGCVGAMKSCLELSLKQSTDRKQFGKSISEFGLVKEKLSEMSVNIFATESVVAMVGHYIDSEVEDFSVEAAISKVFASEALWQTSDEALQIAGGNGFMKEYPYEKILRDARINRIFEGTNEILRLYIALSGMKDAGVYLKEIKESVARIFNEPIKGFGVLSGYAGRKLSRLTYLGKGRIGFVPEELQEEAIVFENYSLRLSKATETMLARLGKDIINQQFLLKRTADITIDLFVGLCVLSRVSTMISEKSVEECKQEINMAKIFTHAAKRRMSQNLRGLIKNEDKLKEELSDYLIKSGYKWDVL